MTASQACLRNAQVSPEADIMSTVSPSLQCGAVLPKVRRLEQQCGTGRTCWTAPESLAL